MTNAMRVAIDGAGRIVVPKSLRDEMHLTKGSVLEIRLREGRLELEPVATPMRLERRGGGGLVAVADRQLPPQDADDVRRVVDSLRR